MTVVRRYDRVTIPASKLTPEGYLRVDGSKIARTGIQVYERGDGSKHREFRPPGEVFSRDTLESFQLVPLTNGHPSQLLTAEDAKSHAVGAVADPRKISGAGDEEWIAADISAWDSSSIDSIRQGRVELSAGYTCEIVEQPGEWNGQKYDAVQTNIRANHLALVDVARAGPEARLKLDRMDAEQVLDALPPRVDLDPQDQRDSLADKMPITIKLDGFEVQVADDNARTIIERAVENARKAGEKLAADVKANFDAETLAHQTTIQKLVAAEKAVKEALDGKMVECDACSGTGKVDGAKCDDCSGKGQYMADADSLARRDARVAARAVKAAEAKVAAHAKLVADARAHLGDEKIEEMDEATIRLAVAKKYNPKLNFDGMPEAGVRALFDAALIDHRPPTAAELARGGAHPLVALSGGRGDSATDPEAARRAMEERTASYNVKAKK